VVDGYEYGETEWADLTIEVRMVDAPRAGTVSPWAIRTLPYRQDHIKDS